MDKFNILALPNYRNFVTVSKCLVHSGMNKMHSTLKAKVFAFNMSLDLPCCYVELVKCMHVGRNIEILWIMFDHVKSSKGRMAMVCDVYDSKCYNVMMRTCVL